VTERGQTRETEKDVILDASRNDDTATTADADAINSRGDLAIQSTCAIVINSTTLLQGRIDDDPAGLMTGRKLVSRENGRNVSQITASPRIRRFGEESQFLEMNQENRRRNVFVVR
jgi:hypothetical protein